MDVSVTVSASVCRIRVSSVCDLLLKADVSPPRDRIDPARRLIVLGRAR